MKKNHYGLISGVYKIWKSKFLRRMRIATLLIFISLTQTFALDAYAQNKRLNLDAKNETIINILEEIEDQSEFYFMFDASRINVNQRKTVDCENQLISNILDQLFEDTGITYRINDRQILLTTNDKSDTEQQRSISGKVTDASGLPLPGVTILIKGTTNGAVTDIDGVYTIKNAPGDAVLIFSFVGMNTQEINVGGKSSIDVMMTQDAIGIDEVVAIGYGTVKKSDLTGAVSSVKSEDLPKAANVSVQQMLSGKAAGVEVKALDAQPGGGISILIRGAASTGAGNEPLYIIDGFPVSGGVDPDISSRYTNGDRSPLNSINPNDIESIEILKDASATAIYGARAANGVVLITTKTGKQGKISINYDLKQGFQKVARPWDMMNASEYMQAREDYRYESWMAENMVGVYGGVDPENVETPYTPAYSAAAIAAMGPGTDWIDEVTRDGSIKEHNLSISGISNKTKYLMSVNYYDQNGIVKKNDFKRITGRINLEQGINDWLTVGVKASGSSININNPTLGTGGAENTGIITAALNFTPILPVKTDDGNYSIVQNSSFFPNPVSLLEITNSTQQDRLLVQSYFEIEPIKNLKLRTQLGFDKQEGINRLYLPKSTLYGEAVGGQANITQNNRFDKLFNTTISYTKNFLENHNFSALLGYEYQKFGWDGYGLGNNKFSTDAFLYNNIGSGEAEKPTVSSYKGVDELASYFGRLNYSFKERYLFTFTMRADGSTKFGEGNKFGYFPSGAFAWRVSEEEFMKTIDWLSNLKLRLSAGQTGNSNISGAYSYYSFGADYYFGSQKNTGSYLSSYANPELQWETTTEYNLGLDVGFFDNRISASVELFQKEVSDLLGEKQLKTYLTLDRVAANLGKTQSKGYEVTIRTINTRSAFKWTTDINFSAYYDRWLERSPDVVLASYETETDPLRVHWGYETDGFVQPGETVPHMPGALPGILKIKDINGYDENNQLTGQPDGIINNADVVKLANADPNFTFGLTNNFEYKSFDLNIHIYGMLGILKYNQYLGMAAGLSNIDRGWNYPNILDEFWSSKNQNAKYPNVSVTNPFPGGSQYLLQKADFVRVKNITLGYTLNNIEQFKKFVQSARIYVDLSNPFVFTNFEGIDPEFDGLYPPQKTLTIGLNVNF